MTAWQPMSTAPTDRPIEVKVKGYRYPRVVELVPVEGDDAETETWAWACMSDDENDWPRGWDDGICWAVNSDGVESPQPTGWREVAQ